MKYKQKLAQAIDLILESQNLMSQRGNSDVSLKLGTAHGLVLQVKEAMSGQRGVRRFVPLAGVKKVEKELRKARAILRPSNQTLVSRIKAQLTSGQRRLMKKHGTPAEFAKAVYKCVPGDISMDEAKAAVERYGRDWEAA